MSRAIPERITGLEIRKWADEMKNKGGWFDEMWNPITGTPLSEIKPQIRNHCERFSGDIRVNQGLIDSYKEIKPGFYELNKPIISQGSDKHFLITPFGTSPTFHKYRLDTPKTKYRTGRNLYVNAFADTFEMPETWIQKVITTTIKNEHHNFILISNEFNAMQKFLESFSEILCNNLWLGFKVTEKTAAQMDRIGIWDYDCHFFVNIDTVKTETVSMLETFLNKPGASAKNIEWILVNESKGSSKPLISKFIEIAECLSIPVFFDTEDADLPHVLPDAFMRHTLSDKKKALTQAKCAICEAEHPKKEMYRIGWTKGRNCSISILGFLCEDCFEKYKTRFPLF